MIEPFSRRRQQAEIAFGKIQTPSTAHDRAFDKLGMIKASGEAKTLRLREARLAKQLQDELALEASPALKRPTHR